MGFKDFFNKVGRGIRTAGKWAGDKIKKGVGLVGRIARPVMSVIGALPGGIGTIGKIGGAVIGGIGDIVNSLPENRTKDKLTGFINTGQDALKQGVDKANDIANKANEIGNKVIPVIDKTQEVVNRF